MGKMIKNQGTIAILGGMGPQASAKVLEVMVSMAARDFDAKTDAEFPEVVLDSIPVADFISNKRSLKLVLKTLQNRVRTLENFRPICFAIACNTAHIMLDDLQAGTKIPFVSIIEEVKKQVVAAKIKKVGLLCTPTTIKSALYKKELENRGIEVVVPSASGQLIVENVIRNVLAGKIEQSDRRKLVVVAQSLTKKGAKGIILGCTELPLIFPKDFPLPIFDSIEILARALLIKAFRGGDFETE